MTFWQDARPATPRLRRTRRRPARPSRRRRLVAVGLLGLAVTGVVVWRSSAAAPSAAAPSASAGAGRAPIVAARWSRALADEPARLLADRRRDVVVVGRATVSAFRARDGGRRWRAHVDALHPDAALSAGTVLLATDTGFVALDRATGATRWRTGSPEPPGAVALVGPDATTGLAVVSTGLGGLAGLDVTTGHPRWSVRLVGPVRGGLTIDPPSATLVAVWQTGTTASLRAVDAATGVVRWERAVPAWSGTPAIARVGGETRVVVGAGDGHYASAVRAFALADGTPRWRTRVHASFQPDLVPLVDGRDVYVVDQLGTVTRMSLATGRARWSTGTGGFETLGRPERVGDAILVANESGEVVTLDRGSGAIRARRLPAGVPVGLAPTRHLVLLAQRLVPGHGLQAFPAARLRTTAGSPE